MTILSYQDIFNVEIEKQAVVKAHSRKVESWNRLISNPHTAANENQYYMHVGAYKQAVERLINEAKRQKARGRKEPISKFLNKQQRYERKVSFRLNYPNAPYHDASGKIKSMSPGDLKACLNACHNRSFEPGEICIQGWEVLTQWDWYDMVCTALANV